MNQTYLISLFVCSFEQVISIVPDVLLSSEVRQIVSTWTLAPVRELVLHHAAQLDRLFTTVSGLICILKELQWYFPQCGSTMVHLNSLNSLDNSNVDVDDELVPQGWVDVLYHLDQLDSSGKASFTNQIADICSFVQVKMSCFES